MSACNDRVLLFIYAAWSKAVNMFRSKRTKWIQMGKGEFLLQYLCLISRIFQHLRSLGPYGRIRNPEFDLSVGWYVSIDWYKKNDQYIKYIDWYTQSRLVHIVLIYRPLHTIYRLVRKKKNIYTHMSQHVTICHNMSQHVTTCHNMSQHVTTCHNTTISFAAGGKSLHESIFESPHRSTSPHWATTCEAARPGGDAFHRFPLIKGPDNPTCEVLCRPAWYAFGKRSVGKRWVVWDEWCELVVWDEGCEMSGVRWVVWDELWEMSCVS